uniref:Tubulin delta chain n=1 Tax=Philasterides dicentrarchi TaxID=282688 RepID=A0A481SBJ8_9CILI|nr:I1 delta-tubulin [Philasterides dicentrarchi]
MISSLGGGTGSGLGSRLIEEFKDIFNDIQLINSVVFPNRSGETTLQHYNCVLSLAHLQSFSDCIIYFQNDKINNYLSYSKSKTIDKSVDITNINQYIASQLHNLVRINDYSTYNRFYFDLLMDTAPMPDFKFVELYSTPYYYDKQLSTNSQATWEKVMDTVSGQVNVEESYMTEGVNLGEKEDFEFQDLKNYRQTSKKNVSISVNTVFKSGDVSKSLQNQTNLLKQVNQKIVNTFNPVSWNPDCCNNEFIEEKLKEGVDHKMMLSMANRSSIADIIKEINDIGYNKFKANAFLHWYYKYELEKQDFQDAFVAMDNIIENYNSIK